jgi:hypothetical protein
MSDSVQGQKYLAKAKVSGESSEETEAVYGTLIEITGYRKSATGIAQLSNLICGYDIILLHWLWN